LGRVKLAHLNKRMVHDFHVKMAGRVRNAMRSQPGRDVQPRICSEGTSSDFAGAAARPSSVERCHKRDKAPVRLHCPMLDSNWRAHVFERIMQPSHLSGREDCGRLPQLVSKRRIQKHRNNLRIVHAFVSSRRPRLYMNAKSKQSRS